MHVGTEDAVRQTRSFAYGVAHWVSVVVHPIAFPLLTLALVTYAATHSLSQSSVLVLLAIALTSLPITALVTYQVVRGRWTDMDVSVRQQRFALYPAGFLCTLALAVSFVVLHAPRIALGATLALVIANVVDGVINLSYKVSAHATGAAACAVLLWAAVPLWGVPAAVAALAVGWSRVVLGRHTRGQVLLGWMVGAASTFAALAVLVPTVFSATL